MVIRPSKDQNARWNHLSYGNLIIALGNMSQFHIAIQLNDRGIFIGVEGKGCFTFPIEFAHKSFVEEKLRVLPGDAANIADILNTLTKQEYLEQGYYYEHLCGD